MKLMCPRCSDSENAVEVQKWHAESKEVKRKAITSVHTPAHPRHRRYRVKSWRRRTLGSGTRNDVANDVKNKRKQAIWYDLVLCFERALLLSFELHWFGFELQVAALLDS